ncbi:MAG: DM13 domain-containing protein [Albidovulum sp.]|nr:DM13 domain-containing protein [Albidovulum sp.]
MWRALTILLFGGMAVPALGVGVVFLAYPYVFPPPPAMDNVSAAEAAEVVATGTFIHANPSDPIHYGKGGVKVLEKIVFLEEDFEVGPGPAFHVLLVPEREIRSSAVVDNSMYVDLGQLRAFKGSQRYEVPDGVDLANYPSVVIWCERFNVLISPADLQFSS